MPAHTHTREIGFSGSVDICTSHRSLSYAQFEQVYASKGTEPDKRFTEKLSDGVYHWYDDSRRWVKQ